MSAITPPAGAFGDVAEIDFVSMYPSIMAARNVSPVSACRPARLVGAFTTRSPRRARAFPQGSA